MAHEVIEVQFSNGGTALVEAREVDGGGATKTASGSYDFTKVTDALEGVSEAILAAARKAAPKSVSVELGIELVVKFGQLTGLIVNAESKASLKVTLNWEREAPAAPTS